MECSKINVGISDHLFKFGKYVVHRTAWFWITLSSWTSVSITFKFYTDNFIQRTKQRYNNTRSLSTKMNLADMQTEIKLRPPYQISLSELGSANGFAHLSAAEYKGTGKISAGKF